ncbi:unnamed protein product [Ambrosiozyma monospora]|uniref:Unnamed protein product n=1 Tax=Ambrosiozyma monospora TaxID=43982 RepID=A0ACB5SU58_AMBMO|nr:unnamed protein product [Ambrosiozyma monospora]
MHQFLLGLSNLRCLIIGGALGINSLKKLPDSIEMLDLIGSYNNIESLSLTTSLETLRFKHVEHTKNMKNVQFPSIENCDQLVNLRSLKVLDFHPSVVSHCAKNLPVTIKNLEFSFRANLPSLGYFNFKHVPNLYTLRLGVRPGKLNLSGLPKSVHFLQVNIYHGEYPVTVRLSQVPEVNIPVEKKNTKVGSIISCSKYPDDFVTLLDLTQLKFDRFSAIMTERPTCSYVFDTVIKLNKVSSTLKDFTIEKCNWRYCDKGFRHFRPYIPQIHDSMVGCGVMRYKEIMKLE